MKFPGLFIILLALSIGTACAQPGSQKKPGGKDSVATGPPPQDTLPLIILDDAVVMTKEEKKEWDLMIWRVEKVWPYVQEFTTRLAELDRQLAALDKKNKKRKTIKQEQDKLKAEFEEKLKNLSQQQGQVIINLIHRQTGRTAYDLIKDYKSGMSATFYQGFARINGMDLKDTFDPESDEDQLLNKVLVTKGL